jgi:hypothetical protein
MGLSIWEIDWAAAAATRAAYRLVQSVCPSGLQGIEQRDHWPQPHWLLLKVRIPCLRDPFEFVIVISCLFADFIGRAFQPGLP